MKYLTFLIIPLVNCEKIIKNMNVPSCRNCIYYKPESYSNYDSHLSKCEKFGEKNIITDKIRFDYADMCRKDDSKCGYIGKYFEEEKNIKIKMFKHTLQENSHILLIISFSTLYLMFYSLLIRG